MTMRGESVEVVMTNHRRRRWSVQEKPELVRHVLARKFGVARCTKWALRQAWCSGGAGSTEKAR